MKSFIPALLIVVFVGLVILAFVPARAANAVREKRRHRAPPRHGPLDLDAMLHAIRDVETGDNPRALGSHGERSAYQFTALTWRSYARVPFQVATLNPQAADLIAYRHAQHLLARLQARGLTAEPELFAAAWRFGSEFALACARTDYARRAAALYRDYADVNVALHEVSKIAAED